MKHEQNNYCSGDDILMHFRWHIDAETRQHFTDIFKCIFLNEVIWIPISISLNFVPKGKINNIPASVQIMAWHWPGDKSLSEPVMA